MGVFVAGVPSSLAPRTPFFSRVLAPLPLPRLSLLRRLKEKKFLSIWTNERWVGNEAYKPVFFSQRRFDQQRHFNFVWANKRISGQFSHACITWTKEECSFNPGLRFSPVDTCAYLFYLFLFFLFSFLFFCNSLLDSHGLHYDSHGSHGSHYNSHGSHNDSHGSLARMLVKLQ